MDALVLILQSTIFAFAAGWFFARDERVFAVGILATGIGGSMAQNPFPTAGGDAYGFVGMILLLGGVFVVISSLTVRLMHRYSIHNGAA